jgi:membrane associated rhomboid family serine protease
MTRTPAFNLPPVIVWLAGAMAGLHVIRNVLPNESAVGALLALAFIPARYEAGGAVIPGGEGARYWSPLTHALLHADWLHLGVNLLWMASFGGALARRFAAMRFLVLGILAAVAGAGAFYALHRGEEVLLVGASGAVSGMMAATACFAFSPGGPLAGGGPHSCRRPAEPLLAALAEPRALSFIAVWFVVNLLFGLTGGLAVGLEAPIAWEAHIGGFVAGVVAFPLLDPVPRPGSPLALRGDDE